MTNATWIIGSNPACDLVVQVPSVSRRHCRLSVDGDALTVEDLGSTNGTFVNGRRIEGPTPVTREDRITLGTTEPMPWPDQLKPHSRPTGQPSATTPLPPTDSQVITIGRSPKNTLVLDEANVSSFHARLTIAGGEVHLEDLGSTNGTSVGTVANKIRQASVQPGDTVFFGSTAYPLDDLLRRAGASAHQQVDSPSLPSSPRVPVSAPRTAAAQRALPGGWLIGGAAVAVALVVVVALFLFLATDSGKDDNGQAKRDASESPAGAVTQPADTRAPTADSKPVTASAKKPSALTFEQILRQSLCVVACTNSERTEAFRTGTAFAIDQHHLVTTASALQLPDQYPVLILYHPETKQELTVTTTVAHPQYQQARQYARQARQEYETFDANIRTNNQPPADGDELESLKKKHVNLQLRAIEAYAKQACYDVALITTRESLDHWLPVSSGPTRLRPKQKLQVVGYAIDSEDLFFDPTFPMELHSLASRVDRLFPVAENTPPLLRATCSNHQWSCLYNGSPVINGRNEVVAIYIRPTPPLPGSSDSSPPATLDATLVERAGECNTTP